MSDLEKLKEKVQGDPSSTLFVPLAEEYRKAGRLDEAIDVLKAGISRQPGYVSARVALGKIYLEKNMMLEARDEFEKVVHAKHDNLFAQRKLADIYRSLNEDGKAMAQYDTVLSLNPFDSEAKEILDALRSKISDSFKQESQDTSQENETPNMTVPEPEAQETPAEQAWQDQPLDMQGQAQLPEDNAQEIAEAFPFIQQDDYSLTPDMGIEITGSGIEAAPEEKAETIEQTAFEASVVDLDALSQPEPLDLTESIEVLKQSEHEEIEKEKPEVSQVDLQATTHEIEEVPALEQADLCIQNDDFTGAMKIYKAHLTIDNDNSAVLQRLEELKALLKMLGRENEMFEAGLADFVQTVRSKRDEFFGNS